MSVHKKSIVRNVKFYALTQKIIPKMNGTVFLNFFHFKDLVLLYNIEYQT